MLPPLPPLFSVVLDHEFDHITQYTNVHIMHTTMYSDLLGEFGLNFFEYLMPFAVAECVRVGNSMPKNMAMGFLGLRMYACVSFWFVRNLRCFCFCCVCSA